MPGTLLKAGEEEQLPAEHVFIVSKKKRHWRNKDRSATKKKPLQGVGAIGCQSIVEGHEKREVTGGGGRKSRGGNIGTFLV